MYCFATLLLAVTIVSTGEATKAADAELFETLLDRSVGATKVADAEQYETMLDRSGSVMDRSGRLPEDRFDKAEGEECDQDDDCAYGLVCTADIASGSSKCKADPTKKNRNRHKLGVPCRLDPS